MDNLLYYGFEVLECDLKLNSMFVLFGFFGVGKFFFINLFVGIDLMKIVGICEDDSKGKYMMIYREMYLFMNGWIVIDIFGMCEFGVGFN